MLLQLHVWSFMLLSVAVGFDLRSMWNQMGIPAKLVVVLLFLDADECRKETEERRTW